MVYRPWQDRSDLGAVSLNACSFKAPAVIGHVRHLLLPPDRKTARIADQRAVAFVDILWWLCWVNVLSFFFLPAWIKMTIQTVLTPQRPFQKLPQHKTGKQAAAHLQLASQCIARKSAVNLIAVIG